MIVERSVDATAAALDGDAAADRKLLAPLTRQWQGLDAEILAPPHWPRDPLKLLRFV